MLLRVETSQRASRKMTHNSAEKFPARLLFISGAHHSFNRPLQRDDLRAYCALPSNLSFIKATFFTNPTATAVNLLLLVSLCNCRVALGSEKSSFRTPPQKPPRDTDSFRSMKRVKRAHHLPELPLLASSAQLEDVPGCPASPVSVATPVTGPAARALVHQTSFKRKRSDSDAAAFDMLDLCLDLEWALQSDSPTGVDDDALDGNKPLTI